MKITARTKWKRLAPIWPLVDKEQQSALMDIAERELGVMWQLKLKDFFGCVYGDFSVINVTKETKDNEVTALQYVWCLRFSEFVTQLTELLEKLVIPDTAESKQAQSGLVHLSFEESVYTFCQEYFHLQSFNAADTLTVHEYLLARTGSYNKAMYQRNLAKITERAMKTKRK